MIAQAVSIQTLKRLPVYLNCLKLRKIKEFKNTSAKNIADMLDLSEIQVRKDLAGISGRGKPKIGYVTTELIDDIEEYLGCRDIHDAVLVGAGKLGRALLSYSGFEKYGLNIVAAFDENKEIVGNDSSGKQILHYSKLENMCKRMKIKIGIITVPATNAQEVCDKLIDSSVEAIWNFAPIHLKTPSNILVKDENMAVSLAVLSNHLKYNKKRRYDNGK